MKHTLDYCLLRLRYHPKKKWVRRFLAIKRDYENQLSRIELPSKLGALIHTTLKDFPIGSMEKILLENSDYEFSRIYN